MYSAEGADTPYGIVPTHMLGRPSDNGDGAVSVPRPGRPWVTTGDTILDRFIGPFCASTVTLIDSGHPYVHDLSARICARALADIGEDVVFIDGGNMFDPYSIVTHARRSGVSRDAALDRVRVARAFTAHQMTSILHDSLAAELGAGDAGPRTIVISCLPDLYLDKDVWQSEALSMLGRAMGRVRELTKRCGLITIVTNHGLSKLASRKGLGKVLYSLVDRVVRMERGAGSGAGIDAGRRDTGGEHAYPWAFRTMSQRAMRGVMTVTLPREGKAIAYRPVPGHQRVLDEYGPVTEAYEGADDNDENDAEDGRAEVAGHG